MSSTRTDLGEGISSLHLNTERTWRGGEKQTLSLVLGLLQRGHPAELICQPGSPLEQRAREQGVTTHAISMRGELHPGAVRRIRRIQRQGDFAICHMHTSHAHALGVLARGFRRQPKTIVARRVDFSIYRKGLLRLNWIKYRFGVDRYIAISEAISRVLVRDGVDSRQISVVHSGVSPLPAGSRSREEVRKSLGLGPGDPAIGNIAHLAGHKGQIHLIEAAALLREEFPRARVFVVGEGEERARLEAAIERLGLGDRFRLLGFQADVQSYLGAFDLFVMPSLMEGLCTSILDALLAGLPVVASRTGGIPEIIQPGRTGWLASPGDAEELARQIAEVLRDRARAEQLAAEGKRHVESHFSVEQMVEGSLAVYRDVLSREGERLPA